MINIIMDHVGKLVGRFLERLNHVNTKTVIVFCEEGKINVLQRKNKHNIDFLYIKPLLGVVNIFNRKRKQ